MRSAESLLADSTLEWWPTELADEVMPEGRSSPSAWVVPMADGGGFLLHDGEEGERNRALADGEVVAFCTHLSFGNAEVRVDKDGGCTAHPPMPAEASLVWAPFDPESISNSVGDLVTGQGLAPGEQVDVQYYDMPRIHMVFSAAAKQFVVSPATPTPPNLPLMDGDTNETH